MPNNNSLIKQPLVLAFSALLFTTIGVYAGFNTGKVYGVQSVAESCNESGRFEYSKQVYHCPKIKSMTVREFAAPKEIK